MPQTDDNRSTRVEISSDPARLQPTWITQTLRETYWASQRPDEVTLRAIRASYCFGAYTSEGRQVGFARVVSDGATFAWLCDVVVDASWRGRGLGQRLVQTILEDSRFTGVTFHLGTLDAHGLYERFGFVKHETMRRGAAHRL